MVFEKANKWPRSRKWNVNSSPFQLDWPWNFNESILKVYPCFGTESQEGTTHLHNITKQLDNKGDLCMCDTWSCETQPRPKGSSNLMWHIFIKKCNCCFFIFCWLSNTFCIVWQQMNGNYMIDEGLDPLKAMMYFHELRFSLEIHTHLFWGPVIFVKPKLPRSAFLT